MDLKAALRFVTENGHVDSSLKKNSLNRLISFKNIVQGSYIIYNIMNTLSYVFKLPPSETLPSTPMAFPLACCLVEVPLAFSPAESFSD